MTDMWKEATQTGGNKNTCSVLTLRPVAAEEEGGRASIFRRLNEWAGLHPLGEADCRRLQPVPACLSQYISCLLILSPPPFSSTMCFTVKQLSPLAQHLCAPCSYTYLPLYCSHLPTFPPNKHAQSSFVLADLISSPVTPITHTHTPAHKKDELLSACLESLLGENQRGCLLLVSVSLTTPFVFPLWSLCFQHRGLVTRVSQRLHAHHEKQNKQTEENKTQKPPAAFRVAPFCRRSCKQMMCVFTDVKEQWTGKISYNQQL